MQDKNFNTYVKELEFKRMKLCKRCNSSNIKQIDYMIPSWKCLDCDFTWQNDSSIKRPKGFSISKYRKKMGDFD